MENKNTVVAITIAIAILIAIAAGSVGYNMGRSDVSEERESHNQMINAMNQRKDSAESAKKDSSMTMNAMTETLQGKTSDDFDKAFIEMMIEHHQGAIDMAKEIPAHAKHAELKKLGEDIITAQTKEIEMMRMWLKNWGYTDDAMMMKADSSMEGMNHDMMPAR